MLRACLRTLVALAALAGADSAAAKPTNFIPGGTQLTASLAAHQVIRKWDFNGDGVIDTLDVYITQNADGTYDADIDIYKGSTISQAKWLDAVSCWPSCRSLTIAQLDGAAGAEIIIDDDWTGVFWQGANPNAPGAFGDGFGAWDYVTSGTTTRFLRLGNLNGLTGKEIAYVEGNTYWIYRAKVDATGWSLWYPHDMPVDPATGVANFLDIRFVQRGTTTTYDSVIFFPYNYQVVTPKGVLRGNAAWGGYYYDASQPARRPIGILDYSPLLFTNPRYPAYSSTRLVTITPATIVDSPFHAAYTAPVTPPPGGGGGTPPPTDPGVVGPTSGYGPFTFSYDMNGDGKNDNVTIQVEQWQYCWDIAHPGTTKASTSGCISNPNSAMVSAAIAETDGQPGRELIFFENPGYNGNGRVYIIHDGRQSSDKSIPFGWAAMTSFDILEKDGTLGREIVVTDANTYIYNGYVEVTTIHDTPNSATPVVQKTLIPI